MAHILPLGYIINVTPIARSVLCFCENLTNSAKIYTRADFDISWLAISMLHKKTLCQVRKKSLAQNPSSESIFNLCISGACGFYKFEPQKWFTH